MLMGEGAGGRRWGMASGDGAGGMCWGKA